MGEWFKKEENVKKFMRELMSTLELECKSVSDLKQMFEVMNMMAFHTRFGKIVDKMEDVREALGKALRDAQCDFEYSELVGFFKQYQYKIESGKRKQVQEKTGDYDKQIEQMKEEQAMMKEESRKKDERIRVLMEELSESN